jgi:hypothetical protein
MRTRTLTIAIALLASLSLAGSAMAKKKKKGGGKTTTTTKKEAPAPKANTAALTQLMGPYKWGATIDETVEVLEKQIADRYAEKIAKAADDKYEQNKLRKEIKAEAEKVKKSRLKFEGQKTGWDVSVIEREYGHKNEESMLVYGEYDPANRLDQQRFFFFVDEKLWKMFIAVNMDAFEGKTFADFKSAMESRYGKAASHSVPGNDGVDKVDYIYWRGNGAYLRAVDLMTFYGTFAIAISDDSVEQTIYRRRAERNPPKAPTGTVVDSVMEDKSKDDKILEDQNSDVINKITKGQPTKPE